MARPSKLTPELQANICTSLKAGIDVATACRREGIGPSTYYEWRQRGEKGEEPFAEFLAATEKVMADVETAITYNIIREGQKNWQAGAWWLRFRKTGGKQQVELSGPNGAPINGTLTPDAADQIRNKILYGERAERAEQPADASSVAEETESEP